MRRYTIKQGKGEYQYADAEDKDEHKGKNIFGVPQNPRRSYLHARATQPTIGSDLNKARQTIKKENPTLKGVLPKVYQRQNLAQTTLGELIRLIGDIALGSEAAKSKDILGKVYEYFLGRFALAEGQRGGRRRRMTFTLSQNLPP